VAKARRLRPVKAGEVVLDIASNDNTLLSNWTETDARLGIDPSDVAREASRPEFGLVNDFFSEKAYRSASAKQAGVITCIAMFYDLCVKPDTLLLGDNKPIRQYGVGDKTFGLNGGLNSIKRTYRRHYTGNFVKIKPRYLAPIEATEDHPVLVVPRDQFRYANGLLKRSKNRDLTRKWVKAKEVQHGDYVVVPRLKEKDEPLLCGPVHVDAEAAWVMGLYVAEGYLNGPSGIGFALHADETPLVDRLRSFFERYGHSVWTAENNGRGITANAKWAEFSRALREWFGTGATAKSLPDALLTAPDYITRAFLSGLLEGDGHFNAHQMTYRTSSRLLAVQVQLLAASIGIMLGLTELPPKTGVMKSGRVINSGPSWALSSSSPELAGFFSEAKTAYKKAKAWENHVVQDDAILVPVHKVETEWYDGEVCNVETGDNTYLVSNAVVHNCDPIDFLRDVRAVMADDGLFVLQVSYTPLMLQDGWWDNIGHEHLTYWDAESLVWALDQAGLAAIDAELTCSNGGSIRVYAVPHESYQRKGGTVEARVGRVRLDAILYRESESEYGRTFDDAVQEWRQLANWAKHTRTDLFQFLHVARDRGKLVVGLGASTKGNTLLSYCGITPDLLPCIADRQPHKHGLVCAGSGIPVVSEEDMRRMRPDYLLALPWFFAQSLAEREKDLLATGTKLVLPLPKLTVLD
jgi:hypothetical protein